MQTAWSMICIDVLIYFVMWSMMNNDLCVYFELCICISGSAFLPSANLPSICAWRGNFRGATSVEHDFISVFLYFNMEHVDLYVHFELCICISGSVFLLSAIHLVYAQGGETLGVQPAWSMVLISRLQLSQKAACGHSAHLHNNQTLLLSLRISDLKNRLL